jgi:hypothetical protein
VAAAAAGTLHHAQPLAPSHAPRPPRPAQTSQASQAEAAHLHLLAALDAQHAAHGAHHHGAVAARADHHVAQWAQQVNHGVVAVHDVRLAAHQVALATHHRAAVHALDAALVHPGRKAGGKAGGGGGGGRRRGASGRQAGGRRPKGPQLSAARGGAAHLAPGDATMPGMLPVLLALGVPYSCRGESLR